MDKQEAAERMCRYYFFKYYIPNKYKNNETVQALDYEQIEQLFKMHYSYKKNGFRERYFKYFLKAAEMFYGLEFFEEKLFIDSIMWENFLFPQQIPYKKNWKTFLKMKDSLQEEDIVSCSLVNDIKKAKEFFTYLNGRAIKDMVNSPLFSREWSDAYAEDTLDLTVLCFSKSFMEFAKKQNMFIDFHEEQSRIDERLKNKIKEKIGDDFEEV